MDTQRARELCKAAGWRFLPSYMPRVMERRSTWLARQNGSIGVRDRITELSGGIVQGGPFRGMRYVRNSVGSVLAAKLLGAYEAELHDAIEAVCTQTYDVVYDVGCAEGYYAVGLASRLPGSPPVVGFDTDPYAKLLCAELAKLNEVQVEIRGFCGPPEIAALRGKRALVVSDCEGYEFVLLAGAAPEILVDSDLIVELHGPSAELIDSFRPTHHVTVYREQDRDLGRYPILDDLPEPDRRIAVAEGRGGPTPWVFLRSKKGWAH